MAFKQGHKAVERVTNDTKMGWNHDSDREKCKWNANSNMASSSICEITGFEIQTRDIHNPPKKPPNW